MAAIDVLVSRTPAELQLNLVPSKIYDFYVDTVMTAEENCVELQFSSERTVMYDAELGVVCNGFFIDDPAQLAVATGQDFSAWLPLLVHESCHMDQWAEDCEPWRQNTIGSVDSNSLLDLWASGTLDIMSNSVKKITQHIQIMELDCERRSLAKIKKYQLPIDAEAYAKKAASYVGFYGAVARYRKFYKPGMEPYNMESIWSKVPGDINSPDILDRLDTPAVQDLYRQCFE